MNRLKPHRLNPHRLLPVAAAAGATLLSTQAFAHTGQGAASGVAHGFMHPVGGLDHVLAMVMVGLLAAAMGGRALYALPAAFVTMMAAGGIAGMAGLPLPGVELGIGLSIVVLGAALAVSKLQIQSAAIALTGFFAIFHGFAHGAEMPADASGLAYGAGFLVATALLHAAGIAAGLGLDRLGGRTIGRFAGAAGAVAGVAILGGVI